MAETRPYPLVDGKVMIQFIPYRNIRFQTLLDEMAMRFPEYILLDKDGYYAPALTVTARTLWNFVYCLGHTYAMDFTGLEDDPGLQALKDWWTQDAFSADYARMYQRFVMVCPQNLLDEWHRGFLATRQQIIAAPVELHPGMDDPADPFLVTDGSALPVEPMTELISASKGKSSRKIS